MERQAEFLGKGSIAELAMILKAEQAGKALAFTGQGSFARIRPLVAPALSGFETIFYNDFSVNPRQEDIDKAISCLSNQKFDLVLAIGGGSVLDFAKAYRFHAKKAQKLVAIPTTFGSGAESTRFATVYVNGQKTSLDDASLLPEYSIVDSRFAESNPRYLKACTGMDALCQAIESMWSVRSTSESRAFAEQAIVLSRDNLVAYVNTGESAAAEKMAIAAHLAGKAINISRTTAAHALAYAFTSEYGIPHGHAVSLTIARIFAFNAGSAGKILDPRGEGFVCSIMERLKDLVSPEPKTWFDQLFAEIGLECDLAKLGITDLPGLFARVNTQRLGNNPRQLDPGRLARECTLGI